MCGIQTHIRITCPDGKPVGLILWADKNKLSTFGTQKGHPIVARLSNLDEEIRSSLGVGGGRIVGLVPVVGALGLCVCLTECTHS